MVLQLQRAQRLGFFGFRVATVGGDVLLCSACGGGARPLLRTASTCCVFGVGLEKEDEVVAEAEQEEKDAHSCSWNRC